MTAVAPAAVTARTEHLDTDYLIVGAGAMAMAFADVVLAEDRAAQIVMVDPHASPGGHWNDAYPFVRLHQPAAFYGLNSTRLGQGGSDLTSGAEIVAYYKNAMDHFLATGRVRFFSMSRYAGEGRIVSTVDRDRVVTVTARRRVVDSTYLRVEVPSVCPPRYAVDADVTVVPPNGLTRIDRPRARYVVIGAGKTGIDTILFLLGQGVSPARLQWIVSNDAWLWDRAVIQPGIALTMVTSMVRSIADAAGIDDLFLRLEQAGIVCRIDTGILPVKWRCATVDRRELTELRRVDDVVRLGRVQRVGTREIRLDDGTVDVAEDTLFVDCSANGLAQRDPRPLFSPGLVTLQSVLMCQQTFSAALIARVELLGVGDTQRNRICAAVPHPEHTEDLPGCLLTSTQNLLNCSRRLPRWLRASRLFMAHYETPAGYLRGGARLALLQRRAVKSMNRMLPD